MEYTDNRLSWWAAIEGAVSLLVASLPVIGGRLISRWRQILSRHTVNNSLIVNKSFRSKQSMHTNRSTHHTTLHEMDAVDVIPGATFDGGDKKIETIISAGSTLAGDSTSAEDVEPVSLIQHMAKMGRRLSASEYLPNSNTVTIKKEVYIREENVGDIHEKASGSPV